MTGLIANVLLNILLVGLLCATIGYCYVLNRRIRTLQDSKSDLADLLKHFDQSTIKASETIIATQTASKKIGDNIQMRIDKANHLMEDLAYSIDKGAKLTHQLEAAFVINRARSRVHDEPHAPMEHTPLVLEDEIDKQVEKNLKLAAKRSPASIEDIVEKVVSRSKPQVGSSSPALRSRAEQELAELIRHARGSA